MTKQEYYSFLEKFSIIQDIAKMHENVSKILETYPNISDMTLKDVQEYLMDRYAKFNNDLFNDFNELTLNNK